MSDDLVIPIVGRWYWVASAHDGWCYRMFVEDIRNRSVIGRGANAHRVVVTSDKLIAEAPSSGVVWQKIDELND